MSTNGMGAGPRVAVVIPCYEDGPLLLEALASLRAQSEPYEVVVVDDGSREASTLEVLLRVEDDGVRVIRQANSGPAMARNAGLAATTGPYVLPLDADDRLLPEALRLMAAVLDADPDIHAVWGERIVFGTMHAYAPRARLLDPWLITYLNNIPGAALIRRSALEAIGGWDEALSMHEDWGLWMSFAERGLRGVGVPVATHEYRLHETTRRAGHPGHFEHARRVRQRHPELMRRRLHNWLHSSVPLGARVSIPLIGAWPSARETSRRRLYDLAIRTSDPAMRWRPTSGGRSRHPLVAGSSMRLAHAAGRVARRR
jgi:glycosyltransferase involved in cell wall biosynthesis